MEKWPIPHTCPLVKWIAFSWQICTLFSLEDLRAFLYFSPSCLVVRAVTQELRDSGFKVFSYKRALKPTVA